MYLIILILFYFVDSQPDVNTLAKEQIEQNLKLDQNMKILQSTSELYQWGPIRIQSYYDNEVYSSTWTNYVSRVLDVAIAFFGKNLMVRQKRDQKLSIGNTNVCIDIEIPTKYQNYQFDADMVFFTQIVNDEKSGYLAYAGPCKISLHDNRPVFGVISWNMFYVDLDNPTNLKFENSVSTAIHEMIHGLGFIETMYPYYIQHSTFTKYAVPTYRDNLARLILNTTRLSTLSKNYFGCYSAEGVVMENQGKSGTADSHFERIIFYNELMTGSAMNSDFQISDFTYTLLEDTGFYRLISYNPDPIIWGKGRGCDFIQKKCQLSSFPEFCSGKSLGCSYERNGIGSCIADQLSDSCYYYSVDKGMDCRDPSNTPSTDYTSYFSAVQAFFGFNGNCFKSSVKSSSSGDLAYDLGYSCYKMTCNNDGSVTVSIGSQSYDCSKNGTVLKASGSLNGELTCPSNVQEICYGKDDCDNQCNGRGICVNKVCICAIGYGGQSCENICQNYREGDSNNCVVGCAQYSNQQTKQCVGCSAHCKSCTAINVCTECESGYSAVQQTLGSATGTFCEPLIIVQDGAGLVNPWLKSEYLLLIGLIQLIFM